MSVSVCGPVGSSSLCLAARTGLSEEFFQLARQFIASKLTYPQKNGFGIRMSRLLVISCSQRKASSKELLPAIDRYDGPAFRVLRKHLRDRPAEMPTVFILSAKYGLVAAETGIPQYDCRLSARTAERLRPAVLSVARQVLQSKRWEAVGLCLGKTYSTALDGLLQYVPEGTRIDVLNGGLFRRLTRLREWLRSAR
jgi:hypothetical protein